MKKSLIKAVDRKEVVGAGDAKFHVFSVGKANSITFGNRVFGIPSKVEEE